MVNPDRRQLALLRRAVRQTHARKAKPLKRLASIPDDRAVDHTDQMSRLDFLLFKSCLS